MNNMKNTLMIGAITLLGAMNAQAQDTKSHPLDNAWVEMNSLVLNVQLNLNDEQQAKVKEIDQRYMKKHQALEAMVPKLTDTEMGSKTGALMDERDNDLKAVLNKDQYASWEKMRHKGTSDLNDHQKEKMKKDEKD